MATAWHGTSPLNCAGWLAATFVKGELSLSPHRGATLVNGPGFRLQLPFVGSPIVRRIGNSMVVATEDHTLSGRIPAERIVFASPIFRYPSVRYVGERVVK